MTIKRQPERINKTINTVIESLSSGKKTVERRILELWPRVSGKKITRHTRPIRVKNGRLIVNVDESTWLYELTRRHRKRLLKKLQKEIGEASLGEIWFRMGPAN